MKKIIIPLFLVSCSTYRPYSPHNLKKIQENLLELREWVKKDYEQDQIMHGTAKNYYDLLEIYAYDVEKEYKKAMKAKKDYTK